MTTIDDVVSALYRALCFDAGGAPDWALFASIVVPDARIVRVNDDGVFEFTPATFRSNLEAMIASGALPSFWEGEVTRRVDELGDVAHVLSIYEGRSAREAPVVFRAVKSMQLFARDGRWWISALLWRREGRGLKIDSVAL